MTMMTALHYDGFVLLLASVAMALIGHEYRNWIYRVPLFSLGFCDFALAVNLLGLHHLSAMPPWFFWRFVADLSTLIIVMLYIVSRRKHARHI